MENDKFVAMLKKQYEENPIETMKAIMAFADAHLMSSGDTAVFMGVAPATLTGFWDENISAADTPVKFETSKLVTNGAIETKLVRGRVYLTDEIKRAKEYRDTEMSKKNAKRERSQSIVSKSAIYKYAHDAGYSLPEVGDGVDAIALSEMLAKLIDCDPSHLRVAIKQDMSAAAEREALRRASVLASLKNKIK